MCFFAFVRNNREALTAMTATAATEIEGALAGARYSVYRPVLSGCTGLARDEAEHSYLVHYSTGHLARNRNAGSG